jgi:hypothetical protein
MLPLLAVAISAGAASGPQIRIRDLDESLRTTLFARVLANSGERCGDVVKTFFQGTDKQSQDYWNVRCGNGRELTIQVAPNSTGSTKILDCKFFTAMRMTPCFTKFK